MVPSRVMFLDSLPYNKANKIDRETLCQYFLPVRDGDKGNEPRTETEILLTDIWAEILELPDISRDDDFFNLGGDSLSGAVVAARIHAVLGVELSLGAIADRPTVSALAVFLDEFSTHGRHQNVPNRSRSSRSNYADVAFSRGALEPPSRPDERAQLSHHWPAQY